MTSLAYDTRRDQVILHGGGKNHDELWIFNLATKRWKNMEPKVAAPESAPPPECTRESVYLPGENVVLTYGPSREDRTKPAVWEYSVSENVWRLADIPPMTEIDPRRRAQARFVERGTLAARGDAAVSRYTDGKWRNFSTQ